ncbi:MAG: transglutaminase-like domain-containing protein, partial [Bacteroidales bacterium]|nr:transglutaminase-like domain-containing protein [Bacteroidales bacterium]
NMTNTLKNTELNALISMLDEPDTDMFDTIKEKLFLYGSEAIPHLENAWDNSFDNTIQQRIENIIHKIQIDNIFIELNNWVKSDFIDILKGFMIITKFQYPDLNEEKIKTQIDKIKKDVWLELNDDLTALDKIKVLNHIFFDVYKFKGNKSNIYAPQNLYINNVLESKKGNALSLGIIYISISKSLNIPVFGVDLPQHFVLAYIDEFAKEKHTSTNEEEVLFYINPFNKGAVFTQKEIELFIKQLRIKPDKSFFKPCDNLTIIKRLMDTLVYSYEKLGYPDKVDELNNLFQALT